MVHDALLSLKESDITLLRGDSGLGFNIRGGIDDPHIPGDTGIFVTKIRQNGAAFKDGRLKEGDKILAINGTSLINVTHEQAVMCFTQAKEKVELKVQHGSQDAILEKRRKQRMAADDAENKKTSSQMTTVLYGVAFVVGVSVVGYFVYKRQLFTKGGKLWPF